MAATRYYEDFSVGEVIESRRHTVSMDELEHYMAATDGYHPLHTDVMYCRQRGLDGLVIHGCMTAGIVDSFFAKDVCPDKVQGFHYGYDKLRWCDVVYVNDTLRAVFTLVGKEERNAKFGVLTFDVKVYNQHNTLVMVSTDKLHIERKKEVI